MRNKKLDRTINESLATNQLQTSTPGYGMITAYDPESNTATVLLAEPGSDRMGELYTRVPCPTSLGVQSVAPEVGKPCWVEFRDGSRLNPIITHFFNHVYEDIEYDKQYRAVNDIPRFMLEL